MILHQPVNEPPSRLLRCLIACLAVCLSVCPLSSCLQVCLIADVYEDAVLFTEINTFLRKVFLDFSSFGQQAHLEIYTILFIYFFINGINL